MRIAELTTGSGLVGLHLLMPLMITPVAIVAAPVADISFQVAAVGSKLSPVLKRFALVTAAKVTVYLTSVSSNLAPVGTNLPGIAPDLRLGRGCSKSNECCTGQNLRNHCVSNLKCRFAWLSVTPSAL